MKDTNTKTVLTPAEITKLQDLMTTKHKLFLDSRTFKIEAKRDGAFVYTTVTLDSIDQSFHYPVEARIDFVKEDLSANEAALFLIDYIDLYFEDFFAEEENTFIPIDWTAYFYDANDFQMRGQVFNKKLEAMADQFLAAHEIPADSLPN